MSDPTTEGEGDGGSGHEAEVARGLPEKDLRAAVDGLTGLLTEVRPGWFNAPESRRGADEGPRRDERRP
ncbi:hypothetical protein ACFWA1_16495 [Streptomyces sp. NPDC060005]|uniref:hypothetical protein n=1 Tax=Streptomyces sp. NPDC060005 TaxID=3347034 RepID=UPI0036A61582